MQNTDENFSVGRLEKSPELPAKASRMCQQGKAVAVDRREGRFEINKSTVGGGIVLSFTFEREIFWPPGFPGFPW